VEAMTGTDALYISTDWEEFRGLARTIETTVRPPYLVIDGRRMLPDYDVLVAAGYDYLPVGGQLLRGAPVNPPSPKENGQELTRVAPKPAPAA
jgi:UDPglucose 6-dehydrogenase